MDAVLYNLLKAIAEILQRALTPELFKQWAHEAIQAGIKLIKESEMTVDDDFILPVLKVIDSIFDN